MLWLMRHFFPVPKEPPTDREFERLRAMYRGYEDGGSIITRRPVLVGSVCVVFTVGFLAYNFIPNLPGTAHAFTVFFLFIAFVLQQAMTATERDRIERGALLDRLLRRPDRCLCPVCPETMLIDAAGHGTCTSCDAHADRAGWPLTELVRFKELEPIDERTHAALLDVHRQLERSAITVFWLLLVTLIVFSVAFALVQQLPYSVLLLVIACMLPLGVMVERLRVRRIACAALLATRPDLWDPTTTPMPISELERTHANRKQRRKTVRVARRIATKTARTDSGV